jgi:hypothetical protein
MKDDYVHVTGDKRVLLAQSTPMTSEDQMKFWKALPFGILFVFFLLYGGLEPDALIHLFAGTFAS